MKKLLFILLLIFSQYGFANSKLKVVLDWYINPDHAPLIIASEKGFFKAEGLEVELIQPADPGDAPRLIATGKADIGITYQPEFMQQVDHGLPVIYFGSLIDKPLNCLTALRSQHIDVIADLKGKRIATSNTGLSSIILRTMLKNAGLSETDVELVHVRYNLSQALLSKKVSAANGMMRNIEIPALEAVNAPVMTFFPEDYGIPNYHELIFISHENFKRKNELARFLTAIEKAVHWLDSHPEEGWQLFIKRYPGANNKVNKSAWFATLPYFAENPADFEQDDWQKFGDFMLKNHLISSVKPLSRYYHKG